MSVSSTSSVASVFDLDGTLVHSRPAVYRAYLEVGVEMPEFAWGLPAWEWLIEACDGDTAKAAEIHRAKNEVYPRMLKRYGQRLPLADYAAVLVTADLPVHVITGASQDAAVAALELLQLDSSLLLNFGLSRDDKETVLRNMRTSMHRRGVYFDDLDAKIEMPDGWARVRVM